MSDSRKLANPRRLADGRVCCSHEGALCATCEAHHSRTAVAAPPDPYAAVRATPVSVPEGMAPPDSYAAGIAKMRGAQR